jgi:hypothetical protein
MTTLISVIFITEAVTDVAGTFSHPSWAFTKAPLTFT